MADVSHIVCIPLTVKDIRFGKLQMFIYIWIADNYFSDKHITFYLANVILNCNRISVKYIISINNNINVYYILSNYSTY